MKLDSPLFNRIRVKPEQEKKPAGAMPVCQWPGCECEASHRAPKGRLRENQYWQFCLEHVREYNSTYNYFAGMSDDAVSKYQKDAMTGHRPTWKMGTGSRPGGDLGPDGMREPRRPGQGVRVDAPHGGHDCTAPPSMLMPCPLTAPLSTQSRIVWATSAGETSRLFG